MGASSFPILAEMYLQFTECNNIHDVLMKHKIAGYFRYADDVLLIYNEELTHVNLTLQEFNNIHPELQFTKEEEQNNKINFLDVTIQRTENNLLYSTYLSAINYMINRLNTHPMEKNDRNTNDNAIKYILQQNQYQINESLKQKLNKGKTTHQHHIKGNNLKQNEWVAFRYLRHETKRVTNIIKDTSIKTA
jgi:hypothetical protein